MRFSILGAGGIARKLAETVRGMKDVQLYAIASRDVEKARAYAQEYGFEKAYGSYEDMLADPKVELVYIAVPHSHHHQWTIAALNAGKHVLCEKAFAASEAQAREMLAVAEEKKLLLTEAIWTRYMPSRRMIDDILAGGAIGEICTVSSNLGYRIDMNERMVRPELCGGCLLDLTVYTLNFSSMILGDDIREMHAHCVMTDTGVDGQDTVTIAYNNGKMASMFTTMYTLTDRSGYIYGRDGYLEVVNINNPSEIRLWGADRNAPEILKTWAVPEQITGYEYEVLACKKAIEEGRIECPEMPHSETLEIMHQMDAIRAQFGIRFPGID